MVMRGLVTGHNKHLYLYSRYYLYIHFPPSSPLSKLIYRKNVHERNSSYASTFSFWVASSSSVIF